MANQLMEHLAGLSVPEGPFKPTVEYSPTGDCVFAYFDEAESYADRVDGITTILRSIDDDRLVGCQIKGISSLRDRIKQYELNVDETRVNMSMLLLVSNLSAQNETYSRARRRKAYEDLIARVKNTELNIPDTTPA